MTEKFCNICGCELDTKGWYIENWKTHCYDCWKKQEFKHSPIQNTIKRLKKQGII